MVAAHKAGDGAHGTGVPRLGTVFVANSKDDTLSLLDFSMGRPVRTAATGDYPFDVVLGGDGAVFVSTWKDNTVEIYNAAGERWSSIKGGDPTHFAVSPVGRFLYVTNSGSDYVTVVDIPAGKIVTAIP